MSHSAKCPHCGHTMTDLWDYDWAGREEIESECGECGEPVLIVLHMTVEYEAKKLDKEAPR